KINSKLFELSVVDHRVRLDEPFVLQDLCNCHLDGGGGHLDGVVPHLDRVANARKHVGNAVGHRHSFSSSDLPARLADARNLARQRQLPEADAAERELSNEGTRTTAELASVVSADRELWGPL